MRIAIRFRWYERVDHYLQASILVTTAGLLWCQIMMNYTVMGVRGGH